MTITVELTRAEAERLYASASFYEEKVIRGGGEAEARVLASSALEKLAHAIHAHELEECPDVEIETVATGTVDEPGAIYDIAWDVHDPDTPRTLPAGTRVALIVVPDSIEVLPS